MYGSRARRPGEGDGLAAPVGRSGFTDADWMVKDSDLASLHGDPEFQAIVAEIKKRIGKA